MAENVEDIEAKLAAYVDGELTPAEKVEIETHLEQNPSHRALLHDLAWHRQLLRKLPREKAPGDCTEGFCGQLERDILLGGDELTRGRRAFRINYSPQLLSAAAIVILAVGLAIIVYSVLPAHHPKAQLAQVTPEPAKSSELAGVDSEDRLEAKVMKGNHPSELAAKKGTGSFDTAALALKEEAVGQRLEQTRYAGFGGQVPAETNPRDMMVITVTAEDVKSANEAVLSYLSTNHIFYADAGSEASWKDSAQVMDVGRRVLSGAGVAGGAGGAGGGINGTVSAASSTSGTAAQEGIDFVARPEDKLDADRKVALGTETQLREPVRERMAGGGASGPDRFAKAPATQPSTTELASGERRGLGDENKAKLAVTVTDPAAVANVTGEVALFKQQKASVLADMDNGRAKVILARNMNGQQVNELAACLSQPERGQFASVSREVGDQYRAYNWQLSRENQKFGHDLAMLKSEFQEKEVTLRVELTQDAPAAIAPTTRPAETSLASIKASEAGITRAEADLPERKRGAVDAFKDNNLAFRQVAEPAPGQQPALLLPPTTQPMGGGRVDVFTCVIVLQDNALGRARGPATQPMAGKPATAPAASVPPAGNAK